MPDYSKGKIYTIRNRNDDSKVYVGSTIQSLAVRLGGHKRDSLKDICMNRKLYIEVNNDWSNWYIELYENYSCENREQLLKREGEIIRLIGTLNSKIEGRDKKQYYIDNVDKIKQYYVDNTDKIKQYYIENTDRFKQYYIENTENIKQYRIDNADKIKQYRIDKADKIHEYQKQYYIENADKKKEQSKQYYIENADKIKEQRKHYQFENADKIKEQRKQYYQRKKLIINC